MQKRQTAQHAWISMLHNGTYVKQLGEYDPNYVEWEGRAIGRVNIIGTIVAKYVADEKTYVAFTIDDGSASIRIKAWKEDALAIEKYKIGELVLVIGKPREYNEELYLSPEVISPILDPNLELVRKLQLFKQYGYIKIKDKFGIPASTLAQPAPTMNVLSNKIAMEEERVMDEPVFRGNEPRAPMKQEVTIQAPGENKRQKILALIEQLAGDEGAPITSIIEHSGFSEEEVEMITQELMKEGEIYQNRPGRLSILG